MEQTITSFEYRDGTSDYLKQFRLEKDQKAKRPFQAFM